jgi:hypothetical protein
VRRYFKTEELVNDEGFQVIRAVSQEHYSNFRSNVRHNRNDETSRVRPAV